MKTLYSGVLVICLVLTAAGAEPEPEKPPRDDAFTDVIQYTVQTGDTLRSLARQFYQDVDKWVIIQEANEDLEPEELKAGERITIPVTAAQKAVWEEQVKPVTSSVVNWCSEHLEALGLNPGAEQTVSFAVALGFFLFIAFNFVVTAGLVLWFATKITRMPESTFHRASLCTIAEVACVAIMFHLLGWGLDFVSEIEKLSPYVESGAPYIVIGALLFVDLIVLRMAYRVGWLSSALLSVSRLAALVLICLILFGIAAVITNLAPQVG